MPLQLADQDRARYHLGYMGTELASSVSFGQQVPIQTRYLVDEALLRYPDRLIPLLLDILCTLDRIDNILKNAALKRLAALELGDLKIRQDETDALRHEYAHWGNRLADTLGVPTYAYSLRYKESAGVVVGNIPTRR